jgi:acyl-CoA thioester hydrolase
VVRDGERASPEFRMRVIARREDVDELAHVSNIVYVRWIQEVAVAHSAAVGWSPETYLRGGSVFVVRRQEIDYLSSAVEGDEVDLVTWVESFSLASSVRQTRVLRVPDGRELARASTTWAFVSTNSGKPTRIPAEIVAAFRREPAR